MERGFKSRCEEMAHSLRLELNLHPTAPLSPDQLASHLDVSIWSVTELDLREEDVRQLVHVDPDAWSAITVSASGRETIIVNPNHRGGRYSSDVMHELAHLLLGHEPSTVFYAGSEDLALRGYDTAAEEEANWLAGALLLPRQALVQAQRLQAADQDICGRYGVSRQMLAFRRSVTAVNRQFRKSRAATASSK